MKQVGVLALQGAFIEHEKMLEQLGVSFIELRNKEDLEKPYDGIILPGGESTVQGKLLKELDMFDTIKKQIEAGMPVLATCAGLILLAKDIKDQEETYFGTIPMCVKRNAYGRQLGSFFTTKEVDGVGEVPMTFIRAPYVESVEDGVKVLAEVDGNIVGAIWARIMNDYGHIDENTPSLAMSVLKAYRGMGIGTLLLTQMLLAEKAAGYAKISLSVQKDNYAVKLYRKAGFTTVKETTEEYIMVADLNSICKMEEENGF